MLFGVQNSAFKWVVRDLKSAVQKHNSNRVMPVQHKKRVARVSHKELPSVVPQFPEVMRPNLVQCWKPAFTHPLQRKDTVPCTLAQLWHQLYGNVVWQMVNDGFSSVLCGAKLVTYASNKCKLPYATKLTRPSHAPSPAILAFRRLHHCRHLWSKWSQHHRRVGPQLEQ